MKRHEKCAECPAQHHGNRHPDQIAAERDADHAGGHGCAMRIAGKPHRPQVPHLAVVLSDGDVIDRALLDQPVAELGCNGAEDSSVGTQKY